MDEVTRPKENSHMDVTSPGSSEDPRHAESRTVPPGSKPKKLRRISRACDFCHRRSIRCRTSQDDGTRCQNCVDFAQECTYQRPYKRRGARSKHDAPASDSSHREDGPQEQTRAANINATSDVPTSQAKHWTPLPIANQAIIIDLVRVYLDVIFPIFPFFHRPTLLRKVSSGDHLTNQAFYAAVMSICALASARARDGALNAARWNSRALSEPPSETFYEAAKESIPKDLTAVRGLDYMRACALLSVMSIQYRQMKAMHHYLGLYHTLSAMDGFHDEENWPKQIGIVEIEERRRLFWSTYTLEVFTSTVWGGIIRCRESQSNVGYPQEIDDDSFYDNPFSLSTTPTPSPISHRSSSMSTLSGAVKWLHGWNFTTDLYRILEHAVDHFHYRRPRVLETSIVRDIFRRSAPSQASVLDDVMQRYAALPKRLKETPPVLSDPFEDRLNFQVANIAATLLLLRMVLFTAEGATIEEKCQIASELLEGFSKVPVVYLRGISSPLLHHLAGIGSLLGSVFEEPLSESSYLQVRTVLLAMADLLASLEVGLRFTAGTSDRLRANVARIDDYMNEQRKLAYVNHQAQLQDNANQQNTAYMAPDQAGNDVYQFIQLPPELLEDWPWGFDYENFSNYS